MKSLSVSVIIPTRGRDACLRETLRDLGSQDYANFDVWVVDQNDVPLQGLETALGGKVKLCHEPMAPLGSHAGRNLAIAKTKAEICVFVDDDVRLGPDFVRLHAQAHQAGAPKTSVVAGRVVQPKDRLSEDDMKRLWVPARYNPWLGLVSGNFIGTLPAQVDHVHECNFSARTEVLREVGAFNTEFRGNAYFEGTDLSLKIREKGYSIVFRPEISLIHLQEGAGGNREQDKARHTYWYLRNYGLLNSVHMHRPFLPFFLLYGTAYAVGKALRNLDLRIAINGLLGLVVGLRYFVKLR